MTVDESGRLVTCSMDDTLVLLKDKKKLFTLDSLGYEPESAAVHPGGGAVAVGGADGKVRLYSVQGNTLRDDGKVLEVQGPVTDMSYSQDGAFLAVTDEKKVISVFTVADGYTEKNEFYGHHAKVVCLSWSPDNEHFATGGMDMMVYVWTVNDPDKRIKIPATSWTDAAERIDGGEYLSGVEFRTNMNSALKIRSDRPIRAAAGV
ncbi:hypothetical protein G5714_013889 [Onychostoma macrolepis]|uniref:Uncharacterized protein n=1 Tax=Onychostoma macrolepis TaxID=369639 RepID=A0A7J6CB71_9TELE|nr:hypothetical protein G5714_013889 [Onychostoma macrolepis]